MLARRAIDATTTTFQRQLGAAQDMIDSQTMVAPESRRAIVPPAETFFRLVEFSEYIHQTTPNQTLKSGALRVAEQDMPGPQHGIVYITSFRRDVVVAQ